MSGAAHSGRIPSVEYTSGAQSWRVVLRRALGGLRPRRKGQRQRGWSIGVPLIALAAGMFIYAVWRLATAVRPGSTDAEGIATRVGYCVSAIMYSTFGVTAISLARSRAAKANGNQTVTDITIRVMEHTAGRWLIGIAGLLAIGTGVYRIKMGLKSEVTDDVDMSGMSAERSRWTRRLGAIGEVGRGST